jgi:hypothetical protein
MSLQKNFRSRAELNVTEFFHNEVDASPKNNRELDASYAELTARLFPRQSEAR